MEGLFQKSGHDVKEFSICHETAKESGYDHTHAYFKYSKKLDVKSCRKFDYKNIHPNMKRVVSMHHRNTVQGEGHRRGGTFFGVI